MRWIEHKTIEVKVWKCDFCDKFTKEKNGCCGVAYIEQCDVCGKDICRDHRKFFTKEGWKDYPAGIFSCPECLDEVEEAWEEADSNIWMDDDMIEETKAIIDRNRKMWAEMSGVKHQPFTWY